MTPDQIIREEFERWIYPPESKRRERDMFFPATYRDPATNTQWLAWQASWAVATGHSA
jgi:hypothetical protein